MSTRYALMLAASLARSTSPIQDGIMPDASEEDFCDFVAGLAEAFTQRLTADGRDISDILFEYDTLSGGVLLYDAADTMWAIARRAQKLTMDLHYITGSPTYREADAIAAEAFAALFPHAVR